MTFAASATFIEEAEKTPDLIIFKYSFLIKIEDSSVDPEVIFLIFTNVCFLSPGFILSGL